MPVEKVYMVTSGCYSDYCIRAAFLDEKKATEYKDLLNKSERWAEANVEEWPIGNPAHIPVQLYSFNVRDDGRITSYKCKYYTMQDGFRSEVFLNEEVRYHIVGTVFSAVSKEHAKKLAVELHQEYLRGVVCNIK